MQGTVDHIAIEMTAFAGVDLNHLHAQCRDAISVPHGLLVSLNHTNRSLTLQFLQGNLQQSGFT